MATRQLVLFPRFTTLSHNDSFTTLPYNVKDFDYVDAYAWRGPVVAGVTFAIKIQESLDRENWSLLAGGDPGAYAEATDATGELAAIAAAATLAAELGLEVHAGHGLRVDNVGAIAALPEISELSIGHSIVARALQLGFEGAVREMREAAGV